MRRYYELTTYLTLAGVLFSGYLSGVKFFKSTCAFNEPCPYFLGLPACYFGFAMFLTMFIVSLISHIKGNKDVMAAKATTLVSLLGTLFAGYFVTREVLEVVQKGTFTLYGLGLPTCAYGLIFYIIILALSLRALLRFPEDDKDRQDQVG